MKQLARKVLRRVRRTAPVTAVVAAVRPRRAAAAIRASGLFDEAWYREQLDEDLPAGTDLVAHYLRHGAAAGLSPHPAFVPSWYLGQHPALRRDGVDPFSHYVLRGARRGDWPHPLFDAKRYLKRHPAARQHPGGPLGHYLDTGWREGAEPHELFDSAQYRAAHPDVDEPPFLDWARRTARVFRASRGWADFPRTVGSFDAAAHAEERAAAVRELRATGRRPLVTVVVPTKDRSASVLAAVRSVQAQTYDAWQLVVVDDGSTDDTEEVLAPVVAADDRIEYLRRPRPGGVAAARNAGLARARGDYVAYLDSDNTWTSEFLETAVAYAVTRQARVVYGVSELRESPGGQNRVAYRGGVGPFNAEALRERNYIDCIVLVHERSLLEEVGGFDESLRRMVDWDLFIRMSFVTEFVPVPVVATVYDPWEDRDDRITVSEPWGFRFVIKSKYYLDWPAAERALPGRTPGLTSIVVHVRGDVPALVRELQRLYAVTEEPFEVLLVDTGRDEGDAVHLQLLPDRFENLRVLRYPEPLSLEVATNLGIVQSRGEYVVAMVDGTWVDEGWLAPLVDPLASRSAAMVQPRVLTAAGVVWSVGLVFSRRGLPHHVFRGLPGDGPEVSQDQERAALAPVVLAARADDLVAVRGLDPLLVNDLDSGDLSLRLARHTGRPLRYAASSVVAVPPTLARVKGAAATAQARDNRSIFLDRWAGELPQDDVQVWGAAGLQIVGYQNDQTVETSDANTSMFEPIVVRHRDRPLRWAIKTGVPTLGRRQSWGDWHFALALKESLERLGQEVVLDCKKAWHRPSSHLDDVALVLRGVSDYAVNPQQTNIMWMISHPERVTPREAATYDAVFAASISFAERFTAQHGITVQPLLQCTDPGRFHPVEPDPVRRHRLLFVGNARGVRPSVRAALDAGLVPDVYGVRWEGLLPDGAWQGRYIPNEELPAVYAAAGAVLNDHWEDMQREGFLSNRLFDLAACGARVVSDEVDGLHEVFGDVVRTYRTPAELADAVHAHWSETPEQAERRTALSETVRAEHSFDARARTLLETVQRVRAASAA